MAKSDTSSATRRGPSIFERKDSGVFSRKNVERTNAFFERFGGITVILARFVPVVRTSPLSRPEVGHMPWRKYSLYNLIGAIIWGIGLTMLGYAVGYIPFVRDIVTEYIDVILLAAVAGTAIFIAVHYFRERAAAKREAAAAHPDRCGVAGPRPQDARGRRPPRSLSPATTTPSGLFLGSAFFFGADSSDFPERAARLRSTLARSASIRSMTSPPSSSASCSPNVAAVSIASPARASRR